MAVSTRHLLRKHIRTGSDTNINYGDSNDIFTECGVDHDGTPILVKQKKKDPSNNNQQEHQNKQQSTTLLDDLTKEESELTQFLLASDNDKSMRVP